MLQAKAPLKRDSFAVAGSSQHGANIASQMLWRVYGGDGLLRMLSWLHSLREIDVCQGFGREQV